MDTSPSARFAASKKRVSHPEFQNFVSNLSFTPDDFQIEACHALEDGFGVLVAAPTGAGKTVVGEFATFLAYERGKKVFYTTPIKALSNQKYSEFVERYGSDHVGLLTGDVSVNGEAPIVVMTTEVLRNMIYAGSNTLENLGFVVLDEVHFLGDKFRGAVWEEILIHLPQEIPVISLSATVSNVEEFGEWLSTVRGEIRVILSETRPVPLHQYVLQGNDFFPLLSEGSSPNKDLVRISQNYQRIYRNRDLRNEYRQLPRSEIVNKLAERNMLPAIFFIFSRAACDAAVRSCAKLDLTSSEEKSIIRSRIEALANVIAPEDLSALNFGEWSKALERGIASHHAGLIPPFKELTEELFQAGYIRVVFATETLALGINMPAKTVVLEKLTKWNGEAHVEISPGEFTQLTGRAGRRGIDIEGNAVIVWSPEVDIPSLAGLATTRTYPLRSSFYPTYNMAVNLLSTSGKNTARELLASSFAQFQADRSVVGIARQISKNENAILEINKEIECHLGDFSTYAAIRRQIKDHEKNERNKKASLPQVIDTLGTVNRGAILAIGGGRRNGIALVIERGHEYARPLVMTLDKRVHRLSPNDCQYGVNVVGQLKIPGGLSHKNAKDKSVWLDLFRQSGVKRNGAAEEEDAILIELRSSMRAHPCHACNDREEHARISERADRLEREIIDLQKRVENRTHVIPRTFDQICSVLSELNYIDGENIAPEGEMLSSIYSEFDLLVSESIRQKIWNELTPAELASVLSAIIFQARNDDEAKMKTPKGAILEATKSMECIWFAIHTLESKNRLDTMRQLDTGLTWATYRWASGATLSEVLENTDLTAGDFVRQMKQLLDLLTQISALSNPLSFAASEATKLLKRGVIAYSNQVA